MRTRRLIGFVAALIVLLPPAARASDLDDALKLAGRVASYGIESTTVALHRVPDGFPPWIPLPKATLLGSMVMNPVPVQSGTIVRAGRPVALYFDVPADRAAVMTAYRAALRTSGWTERPRFPGMPQGGGGFVRDFPEFTQYCLAGDHPAVLVVLAGNDPNAITLQVETQPSPAREACSGTDRFGPRFVSPLPRFEPVAGLTIDSAGPATDGTTTGARITSSLGGAAVYDAFARQLTNAGWTRRDTAGSTNALYTATFTKTVDGKPYVALLAIYTLDATHYVALTDVSTPSE